MFSRQQFRVGQTFMLALVVLLGLWTTAAAQNNAASSGGDSSNAAKPVLPSSDNGKDEAKATPLPASDTPASRVRGVPLPDGYVVGIGDVLDVNVWKESELSKAVGVRPDGMITLPLVGEIRAVGLTPDQLRDQITAALDKVLSDPVVTVAVVAVNSLSYNVMGNVGKPGYYPLTHPITILDAIALCGGFRDFAKQNKIYVLRADANGKQEKIFFNYKQVIRGQKMAQNILLQPNDTLVVP